MGFTPRRAFMKRGAALLAGVAGMLGAAHGVLGAEGTTAEAATMPVGPKITTLFGSNWHFVSETRNLGELPSPGSRGACYGELFDSPDGTKVGEFYSASFWLGTPFGKSDVSAQALEMHTFRFSDGTLLGMGSHNGPNSVYAIVGGTGRYHGATGSYLASQRSSGLGGDGSADFTFSIQG
jgi:hypothetical protein